MAHEPQFFLPADLVARALASLAEQAHTEIDRLTAQPEQGEPSVKEEMKYRLRDYNAAIRAGFEWGRGVRPVATPRGWLVPSRSTGGVVYEVTKAPGSFWVCSPNCKAVGAHWHTMLALGLELAQEMCAQEDDGDVEVISPDDYEPEPDIVGNDLFLPDAPAELGRRLCEARSKYLAAA